MITLVNTFIVLPENQENALKSISQVYQEVVQDYPGFISARLLVSNDSTKITAIANWENEEYLEAMRNSQAFKDLHNEDFLKSFVSIEPNLYQTTLEFVASKPSK
ncbi:MAG: antibiotic biosynthesis monooxygenase family protein [Microcoleaceae cyanobacterium MO_207.B10]|nr:antibiotic biosynthesis monooxygenase family protein [Microcoleaceae cyanobacterium MO_207.B10]